MEDRLRLVGTQALFVGMKMDSQLRSILQRLSPETRFPATLDIVPCDTTPE